MTTRTQCPDQGMVTQAAAAVEAARAGRQVKNSHGRGRGGRRVTHLFRSGKPMWDDRAFKTTRDGAELAAF